MSYIVEILADDIVWLLTENRRLVTIHQSPGEARYYCEKHFNHQPIIIDRRKESLESNNTLH